MKVGDRLLGLIQRLYAATGSDQGWPDLLRDLYTSVDGTGASFIFHNFGSQHGSVSTTAEIDTEAVRSPLLTAGGVYQVGDGDGRVSVDWAPDACTGAAASEAWSAPGTRLVGGMFVRGGSGSVTISSVSSDWIPGTFSFEVVARDANRDTAPKALQGSFERSFRQRTIC